MKSNLSIKDFLPYNFYCIQDVKKEKEDLVGIKLLLILMIVLSIVCINTIAKPEEAIGDNVSKAIENNENNDSFNNLLAWLELYDNDLTGDIQNNSGNLIVSEELLNRFYLDDNFEIKSIELVEELYKVSIERK